MREPLNDQTLEDSRLLSSDELASLAGVCRETILRLIRRGRLPATRLGKGWKITKVDALALLRGCVR